MCLLLIGPSSLVVVLVAFYIRLVAGSRSPLLSLRFSSSRYSHRHCHLRHRHHWPRRGALPSSLACRGEMESLSSYFPFRFCLWFFVALLSVLYFSTPHLLLMVLPPMAVFCLVASLLPPFKLIDHHFHPFGHRLSLVRLPTSALSPRHR